MTLLGAAEIRALAEKLDLKPILGGVFAIKDWQIAFEKMQSGEILKSVIKPE